jgi:hypothetical protein
MLTWCVAMAQLTRPLGATALVTHELLATAQNASTRRASSGDVVADLDSVTLAGIGLRYVGLLAVTPDVCLHTSELLVGFDGDRLEQMRASTHQLTRLIIAYQQGRFRLCEKSLKRLEIDCPGDELMAR